MGKIKQNKKYLFILSGKQNINWGRCHDVALYIIKKFKNIYSTIIVTSTESYYNFFYMIPMSCFALKVKASHSGHMRST